MPSKLRPLEDFGRRIGRHSGVYAGGSVATFLFGLVNLAVLTRLLPIEAFGRLAVYLLFAAFLTVIYNLGSLQGIFLWVFDASDGDDAVVDSDSAEDHERGAEDKERALFTGLLLTVAIAVLGTAAVFAAAPATAELLGVPGQVEAVRLAALAGATGAVWRLVHNVMRFERRPLAFVVLGTARPALVLLFSIVLVSAGYGVDGALAGVAAGTALAIPVGLVATRRNYRVGFDSETALQAFRGGAFFVPITVSLWIVSNLDLYLVSQFADANEIGPYRVASRLGAGTSYLVSAVLMAWMPLSRTPLYQAVAREHGHGGFGAALLTAFLLLCIWVVLGLALLADVLIRIAPASYAGAAPLVPLIALAIVVFGVFMILYRSSKTPNLRRHYLWLTTLAMAVFVVVGLLLVPRYGGYGAAIAQIAGFGAAAGVMLWLSLRSEDPIPIEYGRLARGVTAGLLCIALGQFASPLAGDWRFLADLAILALFPLLLVLLRAFPGEELRLFVDLSMPSLPRRRTAEILAALERLDPDDRRAAVLLVGKRSSPQDVAAKLSVPEDVVLERFVATLRSLGPAGERESSREHDPALASYLLANGGVASRDLLGRRLLADGVEALELDALDLTLIRLRRIPRRDWERVAG